MKGSLRRAVTAPERLRAIALACPVCFGASDAPMAHGMNWGVLTLLGVTVGVLVCFAVLFLRLLRRSEERSTIRPAPHAVATPRPLDRPPSPVAGLHEHEALDAGANMEHA